MMLAKRCDPVEEIKIWYANFEEGVRQSVEAALEIGRILCEQKQALGHGAFLPWLHQHVSFISERTAQRWMKLHTNRARLKSDSVSDLTSAYRLLEAPSDNEAVAPADDSGVNQGRDRDEQVGADDDQPDDEHELVVQDGGDDDGVVAGSKVIAPPDAEADGGTADVDDDKGCTVRRRPYAQPEIEEKIKKREKVNMRAVIAKSEGRAGVQNGKIIKKLPLKLATGMRYARTAISELQKIHPKDRQRQEAFDYVAQWISDHRDGTISDQDGGQHGVGSTIPERG
jgi:hypothetical protein